jgi:SAM-dependent methyltransferase
MRLAAESRPAPRISRLTSTRRYFDKRADAFDLFYSAPNADKRLLRRGPWHGRELAVSVVARHARANVLDLGCGPGRGAEAVIDAGAASYVGIDLSAHMLALARGRLDRFASVQLLEGDFLDLDIPRGFDVVLALGLFDYLEEPARAAEWMRAHCSATLLASFTRWDWVKGPIRHFHYELLHRCRITDYTESVAEGMLMDAGFSRVEFASRGRRGFFVYATP